MADITTDHTLPRDQNGDYQHLKPQMNVHCQNLMQRYRLEVVGPAMEDGSEPITFPAWLRSIGIDPASCPQD